MTVVTGGGAVCAAGTGVEALWEALAAGIDGIRPITRFSTAEFETMVAALCDRERTAVALATLAAQEAVASAQLKVAPARVGFILGTCFGQRYERFSELTEAVADAVHARGPRLTVSTACSSSTTAVGLGRDLLNEGACDAVIAGGVDVITREVFAGFHAIGALAKGKCAPFGEPPGMSMGEGAGFVVLERTGASPWTHVLGYGLSADAHHETSPDPSGSGVARAIRSALEDAGVAAGAIDFVSAHGTGTDSNDSAEWRAIRTALGRDLPVSSTKSFLGHTQGAAGVLELIALLLCTRRGLVPPTLRAEKRRAGAPPDPVADSKPRVWPVAHALKLSAAFGGANSALLVGAAPVGRPSPRRQVRIAGVSGLGPHGLSLQALKARRFTGAVPAFELTDVVRFAGPRDLDPSGKYACAAAALALADAKVTVRGADRERSGLFTGNAHMPAQSSHACQASIDARGITHIAAGPFTHMVINAPAGTCAKLLSLKGPLLVVSAGASSGLLAIVRAAEHLAARPGADRLLAGGLDELPVKPKGHEAEGAAFALLTAGGTGPVLEGWNVAGPDGLPDLMARAGPVDGVFSAAPAHALGGLGDVPVTDVHALIGGAEAACSAFAFALAADAVRTGHARRVLVVSQSPSICCAAVIGSAHGQ